MIPIRRSTDTLTSRHDAGRGAITIGPSSRSTPLCRSSIPSAWVSFPGPEQRRSSALDPPPCLHHRDPVERLERADQHRRANPLWLGHRVQQRVDAIRAVDVGVSRAGRTASESVASARRTRERPALSRGRPRSRRSPRSSRRARRRSRSARARPRARAAHRTSASPQRGACLIELLAHAREARAAF